MKYTGHMQSFLGNNSSESRAKERNIIPQETPEPQQKLKTKSLKVKQLRQNPELTLSDSGQIIFETLQPISEKSNIEE